MVIGICIAIDLLRQNKASKFVIIEKGNQIGGTWNDNQVFLKHSFPSPHTDSSNSTLAVAAMSGAIYIPSHSNQTRNGPENILARKRSTNISRRYVINGAYIATFASTR
jgi:cation diffusion facilitator CzcD-associated flavoprotein CzcO